MATLSLKKAKQLVAEKPVNDLLHKFAVMRHARHTHSIRFTCVHDSFEIAKKEAIRLHKEFPSERYLVISILDGVE